MILSFIALKSKYDSRELLLLFLLGSYSLHFVAWIGQWSDWEECSDTGHRRRRGKLKIFTWNDQRLTVKFTYYWIEIVLAYCHSNTWYLHGFRLRQGNVRSFGQYGRCGVAGVQSAAQCPWENHIQQLMMRTQTIVYQERGPRRWHLIITDILFSW